MIRIKSKTFKLDIADDDVFFRIIFDRGKKRPAIKHEECGRVWYEKQPPITPASWLLYLVDYPIKGINIYRCGAEKPIVERM